MRRALVILSIVVVSVGGIVYLALRDTIATSPVGLASDCRGIPGFVNRYHLTRPAFDTSNRQFPGLLLEDGVHADNQPIQEPSWKQYGNLGPFTRDRDGAVYVLAVPSINTDSVAPDMQMMVLRVDPASGVLQPWLKVQGSQPSGSNFYGLSALTYDCGTNLLYVASLAGSSKSKENGFIAVINPVTKHEEFRYEGVDALGLEVFGSKHGRYLYVGSARSSTVTRIKLTAAGKPFGEPEQVIQFDPFNGTRANKLIFTWGQLQLHATEFYYNLVASTEFDQPVLTYTYDPATDIFTLAK